MRNMYIDNILPVSQSYQEPPGVSWNYCACPITRLIYPGSPKMKLIGLLWLTHFALVNQLDHFYFLLYLYCYFCIQLYLHCCTNKWYTHTQNSKKRPISENVCDGTCPVEYAQCLTHDTQMNQLVGDPVTRNFRWPDTACYTFILVFSISMVIKITWLSGLLCRKYCEKKLWLFL